MLKHHFIKFGEGEQTLICFHGYEQDSSMFKILDERWRKQYTIYTFDLMHHGKSTFPIERIPNNPFQADEIRDYFQSFFEEHKIKSFQVMGYSLGARFSLYLAYLFPERIKGLYLFAPDGFKKMPLQNFIEHYKLGMYLFKAFVTSPKFFHLSVRVLRKHKIIRQRLHDFVLRKTEFHNQRIQLYQSWQTYKNLHLRMEEVNFLLEKLDNIHLVFGQYDAVIPLSNLNPYNITKNQLVVLEKGHDLFDEEALKILRSRLKF